MKIRFEVPLIPKAKASARHATFQTKTGQTLHTTYKDKKTESFESMVALLAAQHLPAGPPLSGPVRLDLLAVLPRPQRLKKAGGDLHWAPVRPDRDNLTKSCQDALASFWVDDALVVCGDTVKCYAELNERPRVVVLITTDLPSPATVARGLGLID